MTTIRTSIPKYIYIPTTSMDDDGYDQHQHAIDDNDEITLALMKTAIPSTAGQIVGVHLWKPETISSVS
jgi:hypothetical protein